MKKVGLIQLKQGKGLLPTSLDISANPHNYQIMELEGAQLPHVLDNPKVAVAVISTTYINQIGLTPTKDGIFIEDKDSPYTNIVVAREDNKDAQNVQNFVKAYESDEVAKAAERSSTAVPSKAGNFPRDRLQVPVVGACNASQKFPPPCLTLT